MRTGARTSAKVRGARGAVFQDAVMAGGLTRHGALSHGSVEKAAAEEPGVLRK